MFAEAFGFPNFYGRNMNAWIDCMTDLDDSGTGMVQVAVEPGQVVTLQLDNVDSFAHRCPDVYEAVIECSAFVNWRRIEQGGAAVLALSFYKTPP